MALVGEPPVRGVRALSFGFVWLMTYHMATPQLTMVASIPRAISASHVRSVHFEGAVPPGLRPETTGIGAEPLPVAAV